MDQMGYLLRNGLPNKKIASKDTYGVINSSRIIMRDITLPKVEENQIEAILKYQLEDYLPVDPDEYVVKHLVLGIIMEDDVEKLKVLLICVPNDIVVSHLNLFKNIDLKPIILDYHGNAISKLMNFGELVNNTYINDSTIACIDLGYECTSLTITKEGHIEVSRIVDAGTSEFISNFKSRSEDLSEDEIKAYYKDILYQIEMIFRYYRTREIGKEINLIVIHGTMSDINGIEEMFSNYFDRPCIKLDSLSKVKFNEDLSKYAVAIGGLIRVGEV
jgi:type IV pilus assembly protein PilM